MSGYSNDFSLFKPFLQFKIHIEKLVIGKDSFRLKNFVISTSALVESYILSNHDYFYTKS